MVKIGTHSGSFHCDEALGCFLLRQTDTFKDAEVVRTRDESVLSELDVVIDVGGKYDPGTYKTHHCDDEQFPTWICDLDACSLAYYRNARVACL